MSGASEEPSTEESSQAAPPSSEPPRRRGGASLSRFFERVGYAVCSLVVIVGLLELLAFGCWKLRRTIHPDPNDEIALRSPALSGEPWLADFAAEERRRLKGQQEYLPYLLWGALRFSGKYQNADLTSLGVRRRTIDPLSPSCAGGRREQLWVFGGSTVYGDGVPDWATVPSYLSSILNAAGKRCVEVTNFGVEGYVSNQELMLLEEALKRGGRPDRVVFYDGFNDAFVGVVEPADPFGHLGMTRIKLGVENHARNKLSFLYDSYLVTMTRIALDHFHRRHHPGEPVQANLAALVSATVANYEGNLTTARLLATAYRFDFHAFWQPFLFYGDKPLDPFEQELVRLRDGGSGAAWGANQAEVYAAAERRAAETGGFVFLGRLFADVKAPLFIDGWMHLAPEGNRLVAAAIVRGLTTATDAH
jgi:lysophospholipase L1-like esterase